ncbi:23S rRNA (guanosine(2251)-2'-O)-methyltransferase RlmB [Tunturibacter empetritectus]|uniref:23S rRNA (Guanosine2251-2'-O)-methyltransferase n=1 Tax=Tunturiibacter lichenicola TaxID=2051959 RepID=A0A7W8J6F7_9BACT|nr:23S rRNA (guanosine(2251)-2'-O)-methyltransferase RlmB [Edaphobacter lichenicola]MBB5342411.1 23S rRNA (guanosine2251-2'-O)-methyltransferase [Edaphobacter lichenicola]
MEVLYGLHPVEEAIRAGGRQLDHVSVARERRDERLERLIELCGTAGVRVSLESRDQLTRLARTDAHQGVLAVVRERKFLGIEDLLAPKADGQHRFFLALDGVEDPHNLGALLRTADGAGVDGVILPERRSAPVTATVAKTSAGASEHVRIARVTNLVRALEQMKQKHVWVLGLDERGTPDYTEYDFKGDCVLVLGREGAGLHDLVKKTCDHLLRIPMAGQVSSLNVSVAGAIVMYEAMRQRRRPAAPPARKPVKERKGLGS